MKFWTLLVICWGVTARGAPEPPGNPCELRLLPTSELTSYLEVLLDEHVIDVDDLATFAANLDQGLVLNPIPSTRTHAAAQIHRRALNELFDAGIDRKATSAWAHETLRRRAQIQEERQATRDSIRFSDFIRVTGGWVKSDYNDEVFVPDFEISRELVTQQLWTQVMGANPSAHQNHGTGRHPVENMTWWSAMVFANHYSELNDEPKFYPDEQIPWEPGTSAAKGTLVPAHYIDPRDLLPMPRHSVSFGHKMQNWESAIPRSYRLASYGEMLIIANRYLHPTLRGYAPSETNGGEGMWYQCETTRPVATRAPLVIEGEPMFDFFGNVKILLHSWNLNQRVFNGVQTGGFSYRSNLPNFVVDIPAGLQFPKERSPDIGLRLARTLPPERGAQR